MSTKDTTSAARLRRHVRVRKTLAGTPERPRLAVYRSTNHIYAQVIDDSRGHTLAAASDRDKGVDGKGTKTDSAKAVGKLIAQRAKEQGVEQVVFDRGGFRYHGRIKALADSAREAGLGF